jgi:hypothetical protein
MGWYDCDKDFKAWINRVVEGNVEEDINKGAEKILRGTI